MPSTRGRKDPSLLNPVRKTTAAAAVYIVNGRSMKMGDYELPAGVEVPGAAEWPRVEAWSGARRIRPAASGEQYITFEEFTAKVDAERAEIAEAQAKLEAELAQQALEDAAKDEESELAGAVPGKE
jgi:hypothetical protein